MPRTFFFILLVVASTLAGCTSYFPASRYPLAEPGQEQVKVVTIPLPVIASSPNEGVTWGALSAFLIHNKKEEVSTLIAPQINNNPNFGITATIYGALYPSPRRSIEFNLSKSTKVNEDYEVRLRDQTLMEGKLELNAFVFRFSDGSARFFGFQGSSRTEDETNYADKETGFTFSAGYPVLPNTQLVVSERFKDVDIDHGAVKKVPFIRDKFTTSAVPGIDSFTAHAQGLALVYNTLDSSVSPTRGVRAKAGVEASFKGLGSTADYRHYEVELKGFYPLMEARFITVGRIGYNQTLGNKVPFLERSVLGGENTLRGFGRNRYIDSSYLICNLEERIRLFRWEIFDVMADWEVAPFIDLGSVMENLWEAKPRSFVFNPGIGFRAVVRPNIVGRVDIGIGKEGPAVFVGLGYPF